MPLCIGYLVIYYFPAELGLEELPWNEVDMYQQAWKFQDIKNVGSSKCVSICMKDMFSFIIFNGSVNHGY